jgi:hypothetical protein
VRCAVWATQTKFSLHASHTPSRIVETCLALDPPDHDDVVPVPPSTSSPSPSLAICRPSSQQPRLPLPNTVPVVFLLLDLHCQTQLRGSSCAGRRASPLSPHGNTGFHRQTHAHSQTRTCPLRPVAADTLLRPELWVLWDHCDCRTDS